MAAITVYSPRKSERLIYVLEWLLKKILRTNYTLTTNEDQIKGLPFFISYGTQSENALSIPDSGLLWEENINPQFIETGTWKKIPTLYHHTSSSHTLPFDFFSAIFFLISRYEEYYNYTPDKYNRYPATESLMYKKGWLERPLADEWIYELYLLLKENYGIGVFLSPHSFQATYDIDIAFSYRYKGFKRTAGAFVKDLLNRNFSAVKERITVLQNKKNDPFDCFDWLITLHNKHAITPIYFILAALHSTAFDKNNDLGYAAMQNLILELKNDGVVGLHPSYYSNKKKIFSAEKKILEKIVSKPVDKSRQHYIRLQIPETYYDLMTHHIKEDYSMGYGTNLGFRAATGRSFNWYDLKNEKITSLEIHPFCFMDSTAHYEENLKTAEAFERLETMRNILEKTQSQLITVFHNFSFVDDQWKKCYENFLKTLNS